MKKIWICLLAVVTLLLLCSTVTMAATLSGDITNVYYDKDKNAILADIKLTNNNSSIAYVNGVDVRYKIKNLKKDNDATSFEETASYDKVMWCISPGKSIIERLQFNLLDYMKDRITSNTKFRAEWESWDGGLMEAGSPIHHRSFFNGCEIRGDKKIPSYTVKVCNHSDYDYVLKWSATILQKNSDGEIVNKQDIVSLPIGTVKGMKELECNVFVNGLEEIEGTFFERINGQIEYERVSPPKDNTRGYRSEADAREGRRTGQSQSQIDIYRLINGLGPGEW